MFQISAAINLFCDMILHIRNHASDMVCQKHFFVLTVLIKFWWKLWPLLNI